MQNSRDEDLVQDTLLKAYIGFRPFRTDTNLKAWLLQIMKRTSIDISRVKRFRPVEVTAALFADSSTCAGFPLFSYASPSAENGMIELSLGEEVRAAFRGLAEPIRLVIYYADLEGRTYAEIAMILDIPVETVACRIKHGCGPCVDIRDVVERSMLLSSRTGSWLRGSPMPSHGFTRADEDYSDD